MPDNLYRRGKTWYARFQVRGKEYRPSLRTDSRAEAKRRLAELIKKAQHFRFHGEDRHTWKEAVVEWGKDTGVKPSVVDRYVVSFGQIRHILDPLYLDGITRKTMSEIARRPGVTNATRRRDLTAVSAVLSWCVGHGWLEDNAAKSFDRSVIRESRDPIVLPADADIDAVVCALPGNFARMTRFAQYTGMRLEEVVGLRREQIDRQRNAVTLTKTKTSRPRAVPLDARAVGTITGTVQYVGSDVLFWHGNGLPYRNASSRFAGAVRRVEKAKAKEGKPFRRFRFHDLRHWFAVDYLRRGGGVYELQKVLGHASIRTTEIYLAYLTPDEQVAAMSAQKASQ